jgi:chemotaxis protein MotA
MDIATIIGILIAWGSLLYSMHHVAGELTPYLKTGEIILVGGCAIGATFMSMPLHSALGGLKSGVKFVLNKGAHVEHIIKDLVNYAEIARRDGVLALETASREAHDPFLRRGLQLTIDGTDPEIIERIMRIEIEAMAERHKHGKHFFGMLAKFGPGCGLVACLVAQVAMFKNLDGGAKVIGAALATALTGTLYGAMLQNLMAGPVAEKLGMLSKDEQFVKEVILQGVLSIQAGNNPRVVEMQLLSFLSAKQAKGIAKAA